MRWGTSRSNRLFWRRTYEVTKIRQILWSMFAGAAIVFVLYAILLISAGGAKADSNSFISDLENSQIATFSGPKSQFIALGYQVCTDWDNGYSLVAITNNVWIYHSFDRVAAAVLVNSAIENLCNGSYA
jgi:hypothetical protein